MVPEKGVSTLLNAWAKLEEDLPLHIIGDGPCRDLVEEAAARDARISYLGERPHQEVLQQLHAATCLVMPSVWYETFGRTIVEAYAAGTPVIASRLGAMEELVVHQETGLLFEPGSASALAEAVSALCSRGDLLDVRLPGKARVRRQILHRAKLSLPDVDLPAGRRKVLSRGSRGSSFPPENSTSCPLCRTQILVKYESNNACHNIAHERNDNNER